MIPNIRTHRLKFRLLVAASITVVFGFIGGPAATRAQSPLLPEPAKTNIETAVSNFMAKNSVPGISVAVVVDGQLAWSSGFGMADLENSVPATSATLFRLGSISKPLTAVGILQLNEQGKLGLDEEVQKYCPEFPKKPWPITSRELLGHLGGIRHYNPDGKGDVPDDSARHFDSMADSLTLFAADPLVAQPGAKYHYSTYGYTLLGCVLEGAAGQNFIDYERKHVFLPAGMVHTQADNRFSVIPHRTRFYHKTEAKDVQNAGVLDSSYKVPGGGLLSSADDMAHFEMAILAGKLLKEPSRDLMWTSQKTADGKPTGYGLGWSIVKGFDLAVFGHGGGQQGTTTMFLIAPQERKGVVVLANMDELPIHELANEILKLILAQR